MRRVDAAQLWLLSVEAVRDGLEAIRPVMRHALEQLSGGGSHD